MTTKDGDDDDDDDDDDSVVLLNVISTSPLYGVDYLFGFFWGESLCLHNTDSRVAATPDEISQSN